MNNKEMIIEVSLNLFSINGCASVSVRDISKAAGIEESSLYAHFESKQAIFDTIIKICSEKAINKYKDLAINQNVQGVFRVYNQISEELLTMISYNLFEFYVTDEDMSRFRKILIIEQFKNKTMQDAYYRYFMDDAIKSQTQLFHYLMQIGAMKKSNPEALAYAFYAPIFLMMNRFDTFNDEAKKLLKEHIHHFNLSQVN